MAKVHLIEGPVGAGKSTYSATLSQRLGAPHLNLDAWMARLFRPDRPAVGSLDWYVERKQRCIEQIWEVANSILDTQSDVILEMGLVQRASRQAMYERIEASGHEVLVYVLDTPREIRRQRVQRRNEEQGATFSMVVPDDVFEMASNIWEEPEGSECEAQVIIFVASEKLD